MALQSTGLLLHLLCFILTFMDVFASEDQKVIEPSSSEQDLPLLQVPCCQEDALLECARSASELPLNSGAPLRVALITQVTEHIAAYARYSAAVNKAFATTFGHTFIVAEALDGERPTPENMDPRFGKVLLLYNLIQSGDYDYVVWLDADAVFVDFSHDTVGALIAAHMGERHPGMHLVVCREPADVSEPSVVNSGTIVLRSSAWSLDFLSEWWNHTDAQDAQAADQRVFDRLWARNVGGVKQHAMLLPSTAFNSEALFFDGLAAHNGGPPPVLHLMGAPSSARLAVFREMVRRLCACGGLGLQECAAATDADGVEAVETCEECRWPRSCGGREPGRTHMDWLVAAYMRGLETYLEENSGTEEGVSARRLLARTIVHTGRQDVTQGERALALLKAAVVAGEQTLGQHHPLMVQVMTDLGILLSDLGRYEEALGYHNRSIEIKQLNLPKGHVLLAKSYTNVGALLTQIGRYADAAEFHRQSLGIMARAMGSERDPAAERTPSEPGEAEEDSCGAGCSEREDEAARLRRDSPESILLARAVNNMGALLGRLGRFEEAEAHHLRAVRLLEESLGAEHPLVAKALANAAALLQKRGDVQGAEQAWLLAERGLAIRTASYGENHTEVAEALTLMGMLLVDQGKLEEAVHMHGRAYTIWRAAYGPVHPQVAIARSNLAECHVRAGDYEQALKLRKSCLEMEEQLLGRDHPQVASSLSNLGLVLYNLGRLQEAEAALERAVRIWDSAMGGDHINAAAGLNNLAQVCSRLGKHEAALGYYRRSFALREAAFGRNHPRSAESMSNIAVLLEDMGEYERAEEVCNEALRAREAVAIEAGSKGDTMVNVAVSLGNYAALLQRRGELDIALTHSMRALEVLRAHLGKEHPQVGTAENNAAEILKAVGKVRDAEVLYRSAIDTWQASLGPSHINVAIAMGSLGQLLANSDQDAEAERYFLKAERIFEESLEGGTAPAYGSLLNNLAILLHQTRRTEEAIPKMLKAAEFREKLLGKEHPDSATTRKRLATLMEIAAKKKRAKQ
ncbi:hypothetical protein CYMTET_14773 [Cymbomonas tetramitiformis]|uniref:Uncharacterized protein n=1 Tax=Cymbomonas tetramitiformis TaxID=36881 RepID=A0AAE0GFZ3_9CHLO|nr:hypothetical protein CYMTET_14773 [Cymbomonas tetramitiformis]